jgi:hypothetical protein
MDIRTFLQETSPWILVPLGFAYVTILGYFLYLVVRLFRR